MKVDVYDTYAASTAGEVMHFDVLVPTGTAAAIAFRYARAWLDEIGETGAELKQSRCRFCHSENALPSVVSQIEQAGHYIVQLQGCPQPG